MGFPQLAHLIDFDAQRVRGHLIADLSTELVQKEWREQQALRPKDWRDETLSAKNRLFKFLTSATLMRIMGLPSRSINLTEIIEQGKTLLVKAAPSDHLSQENSRVFTALLINAQFETALRRRRDPTGRPPRPFFLVIDEFQTCVSLDLANMLDQVRKFGLFLTLSHQRFGQIDPNITDAVLTNCRCKIVFGGLPAESARLMAQELFIGQLDPKKIKAALYQTKFWPCYGRDKVYGRSTTSSTSSASSDSIGVGSATGSSAATFFGPADWLGFANQAGSTTASSSSASSMHGHATSYGESFAETESVADIPIFFPVPFEELSSVQYYSTEEQLVELTAALKEQFPRHCFIKLGDQQTQPMLVPLVKTAVTPQNNLAWYIKRQLERERALPAESVDVLLKQQEAALLQRATNQPSLEADEDPSITLPAAETTLEVQPTAAKRKRAANGRQKLKAQFINTITNTADE